METPKFIPEPTDEMREEVIKDAVRDEYAAVYAQTAPALWYILFHIMGQKPNDLIHSNSVFNAALSAFGMYIATCVSGTDAETADKIDRALENIRSVVVTSRASDIDFKEKVSISASTDGLKAILQMSQGSLVMAFSELNDEIKRLTEVIESRNI